MKFRNVFIYHVQYIKVCCGKCLTTFAEIGVFLVLHRGRPNSVPCVSVVFSNESTSYLPRVTIDEFHESTQVNKPRTICAAHKAKWHERGAKENSKEDGWNERKSQYAGVPSAGEIAKLN